MSNTYPTTKIVQKDYTRSDGLRNTFIRLTIKRKVKYYRLDVYVHPSHFKKGIVSKKDSDYKNKNTLIEQAIIKSKKILFDFRIQDKPITHNKFKQNFYNGSYGSDSFYDFYVAQVNILKDKLEHNTIRVYNSQIIKLREFKKEATFNDIDLDFITGFEGFIKKNKGNNQNTVTKSIKCIKAILNRAEDQGIIKDNPIKDYKLKQIQGNRNYLTKDELARIERLYDTNGLKPNLLNVLRYFLFSCYTGLRYQDIKVLRFKDIKDGKNGRYISISMIKTKEFVQIPLAEKAEALIPNVSFDNQPIFNVITSQPTNRHLKKIMAAADIEKIITFHCARHTFATLSLNNDTSIEIISKLLGHTDIKTTKIYLRFELGLLTKEIKKWD